MDNYYNLDSIIFSLNLSNLLIICINGVYHLCQWSMDQYNNENKNCRIELISEFWDEEDYSFSTESIKLNCYWTVDAGYDEIDKRFYELA